MASGEVWVAYAECRKPGCTWEPVTTSKSEPHQQADTHTRKTGHPTVSGLRKAKP